MVEIEIEQKIHGPKTLTETKRDTICEIAESIYPGRWSLDINESSFNGNCSVGMLNRLIIHFPKSTIRNENGESHDIQESYIAILVKKDYSKLASSYMFMMRTKVALKEFASGYFHSHAQNVNLNPSVSHYFVWRRLCVGGQTSLTELLYNLTQDGIDEDNLTNLLVVLSSYICWESRDGGPYMYFKNLSIPLRNSNSNGITSNTINTVYNKFIENLLDDEDNPFPELIKDVRSNQYSVTNKTSSIIPIIRKSILELSIPETSNENLRNELLGSYNNYSFKAVSNNSFYQTPMSTYVAYNESLKNWSKQTKDNLLKFNDKNLEFSIDIPNLETEEVVDIDYSQLDIHPDLSRSIVTMYTNNISNYVSERQKYE